MRSEAGFKSIGRNTFRARLRGRECFIQVVGAEVIGKRISETSTKSGGCHQNLKCYESCTRVEQLCVVRHAMVIGLPAEIVRSAGFWSPSQAVSQRVRSRTMGIKPLRVGEESFKLGRLALSHVNRFAPFWSSKHQTFRFSVALSNNVPRHRLILSQDAYISYETRANRPVFACPGPEKSESAPTALEKSSAR